MGGEIRRRKSKQAKNPLQNKSDCLIEYVRECVGKPKGKRHSGLPLVPRTNTSGTLVKRQITTVPRTAEEQWAYEDLERRLRAFFDQHPPPLILQKQRITQKKEDSPFQEDLPWWEKLLQSIARMLKN